MIPLIYDIQLTRNERGIWIACFGDIYGQPANDLQTALVTLSAKVEQHRELADFMLSEDVCHRLKRNQADTAREASFCWSCGAHHFDYEPHLRV